MYLDPSLVMIVLLIFQSVHGKDRKVTLQNEAASTTLRGAALSAKISSLALSRDRSSRYV